MSVDRTSYLLYGFKVDKKKQIKIFKDYYDELMEEKPYSEMFNNSNSNQRIIYDYMGGDYVYIGIVLAKLDEYDDNISIEIPEYELNNLKLKLFENMSKWPKYLLDIFYEEIPKLYFFIHAY